MPRTHLTSEDAVTLYEEPFFIFCFAADRIIPRFHLEGVKAGQRVSVFRLDPATGKRSERLTVATTGEGGWVDLASLSW